MNIEMLAVTADGELREMTVNSEAEVFAALYRAIDCSTAALVRLNGAALWVDEDGHPRGLPGNVYATVVAHALGWRREPFVGTAVFSGLKGHHTVSLPAELRELIVDTVAGLGEGGLSEVDPR